MDQVENEKFQQKSFLTLKPLRMRKAIFFSLFSLFFTLPLLAQDGLPPNPEPGKCYIRCVTPDEWEEEEVRVVVKPAHKRLEVGEADYREVEERVLVKEASKKYVYVPAVYETVTEEVLVEEAPDAYEIIPAQFEDTFEEIELQPAYARYEYQSAMENCESDDPRDCMVMCYVEYPAQKTRIAKQVLKEPAKAVPRKEGSEMGDSGMRAARTVTVQKQVIKEPARVEEVEIPAEYKTIKKKVLAKGPEVREVDVPAEYRTETRRVLKKKGGLAVWEEIDCELTTFTPLPVYYELGSARLTAESKRIIDERLYALMVEKPLVRVELNSHTDSRGSAASNMDLSQRRAQSVVNYLVGKGIDRDRLIAKGYGETRLVNNCRDGVPCSEEEHQKNRRTEFRVMGN